MLIGNVPALSTETKQEAFTITGANYIFLLLLLTTTWNNYWQEGGKIYKEVESQIFSPEKASRFLGNVPALSTETKQEAFSITGAIKIFFFIDDCME